MKKIIQVDKDRGGGGGGGGGRDSKRQGGLGAYEINFSTTLSLSHVQHVSGPSFKVYILRV